MELDGPDSVLQHYLLDVGNRPGDLTLVNYTQRLGVLIRLLRDVCKVSAGNPVPVTKLEQVTVQHLRQCVQHLLSNPVDLSKHGRVPRSGGGFIREYSEELHSCLESFLQLVLSRGVDRCESGSTAEIP